MPPARGIRVCHTYLTYPPKNEIYHNLWYAPWLPFLYSVYSKEFPFSQEMIHMQLILKISEAYCGGGPGWCTYLTVSPNICKLFLKVMVEHILTIWDVILIDWLIWLIDWLIGPIQGHQPNLQTWNLLANAISRIFWSWTEWASGLSRVSYILQTISDHRTIGVEFLGEGTIIPDYSFGWKKSWTNRWFILL